VRAFETKSCELQLVFQLTDKGKYEESRDSIWMGQPKPRHPPVEARASPSRAKMFRCLSSQPLWRRATSIVELHTRRMRRSAQLWGGGCCGGLTEAVPRGAGQCKDLVVHTALCCKYKYDSNWERAVKRKFEFENIQFWGAEDVEMNSSLIFGPINLPTHLQNRHLVSNYSTTTWRCSQIVYESPMKMF
jgi:hypothetical protein